MSQILTFQLSDPFSDYDALRCAAYYYAVSAGETGVCLVLVSAGDDPAQISVVANIPAREASVVLPLPVWELDYPWGGGPALSGDARARARSDHGYPI